MTNVRSITPNDPADFTPELGDYKTLQPFRYWCQKVLPLVYDDSLSYYELLCKVVDYLNKTMEDVGTLHSDVTNLHTAYEELQGYVNNYFSTLDVQEEINNKLDNMASSGELYEIIRKYTDPIVNEQNDKINVLNARMNTFASLPSGSTAGNAELLDIRVKADSTTATSAGNAVREQFNELKGDLGNNITFNRNQIVYGKNRYYYDKSRLILDQFINKNGNFEPYDGWCITDFIPVDSNTEYIFAYYKNTGYNESSNNYYARYDKNFRFISAPTSTIERKTITTDSNTAYVRISQLKERFSPMSMIVEKTIYDETYNYIPFSMQFIGDNTDEEFERLRSDISENKDVVLTVETQKIYKVVNNQLEVLTDPSYININSAIINVNSGDNYYYTGRVYNSENQYSLIALDNNNNVLQFKLGHTKDTQIKDYKFTIPKGATKLIVQSYDSVPLIKMGVVIDFKELIEKVDNLPQEVNDDKIMRSICRMGTAYGQPESVSAMIACKNAGFNIIRVNLQYTSDNIAVLWHDQYINQHMKVVYDSNDVLVPYSETNRIKISERPLALLNQYKWGNKKYTVGIPTAEAIIKSARKVGMELYFECKITLSDTQISNIISLVEKYGMRERVSFAAKSLDDACRIAIQDSRVRVGSMDESLSETVKTGYLALKNLTNNIFWWGWATTPLTPEMVEFLSVNGIDYECGDFKSYSEIESYLSTEYAWYCTGMEIQGKISPLVGQYIKNNLS